MLNFFKKSEVDRGNGHTLLIFMRYPEAGMVKTRLAAGVGPKRAAAVYEKLLRRTLGVAADFRRENPGVRILLFHTPGDPVDRLYKRFGGPWTFIPQDGGHLGTRMENALDLAFAAGAKKAVLIGSDLADIQADDLEQAFLNIGEGRPVLGPADDGGFYLIGLDRPCAAPFRFEEWGSGEIFKRTAQALEKAGFSISTVSRRSDIDRPSDLAIADSDPVLGKNLSVIIPTLHQAGKLAPLIDYLDNRLWPGDEIIVVEGRHGGETRVERVSETLVAARSPLGRGIQQGFGAMLATGDLLLFLHDDTIPPPDFPYLIRKACIPADMAIGCFRLAFCPPSISVGLIAGWANLRTTCFGLPYGDQGLFCKRELFDRAGGFNYKYLFEDVELVRGMKKLGRLVMLPPEVFSSPDRYFKKGPLTASMHNHLIMLLHLLGVSESRLYTYYYR